MRRVPLAAAVVLLTAAGAAAPAAALDPAEEAILAHAAAHLDEAVELIERSVAINSGTLNFAGVRRVGELFAAELEALGFTTRWIDGAPFERAGHLVAERGGDGPKLLLIGHLDTVFEPDSPFQEYTRTGERSARGPGVTDMKGGLVVMLHALRALEAAGVLNDLRLAVVLTGDEEKAGRPLSLSRGALRQAAAGAVAAIGFEDGDGDPETAVVARRGSTSWRLEVRGVPAHSSQVFQPEVGAGAIFEAARVLEGFREGLAGETDLTFNPGVILGGTQLGFEPDEGRGSAFGKNNVVAEHAVVSGDLRALTPEQLARAKAAMDEVVARPLPRTEARLTFSDGYPPMAASEGNLRLLALYDEISRELGHGPVAAVDPRNAGAADVSFVAARVGMALDGIGLMGSAGHTVEETADLATLQPQIERAAVLLYRLSRGVHGTSERR